MSSQIVTNEPEESEVEEQRPLTAVQKKKAADNITRAVAAIVLDDPFYGYFLLRQDIKPDDKIKGLATNGKEIRYNPRFVQDLTLSQLKGAMRHEVMHIANLHHLRRQGRGGKVWNQATDYVVNAIGTEAGWDLPPGALHHAAYKDMSVEQVYGMLPKEDGSGGQGGPQPPQDDKWNFGEVEDHPDGNSEAEIAQLEQDAIVDTISAAEAAKMMGKLPAHIARLVEKIKKNKLPWKEILARYLKAIAKNDYSWTKPNRRYLDAGFYIPSMFSTNVGPVALAIDTSGSIGHDQMEKFIAELNGILKFARPQEVKVIYCDAQVQRVETYGPDDDIRATKPAGGGGTDFRPVFDWVKDNMRQCEVVIYLTDMYGCFPETAPNVPTIWVSTTEIDKAPFGKVVHL
jgi:predicted metal-dependent peptidase